MMLTDSIIVWPTSAQYSSSVSLSKPQRKGLRNPYAQISGSPGSKGDERVHCHAGHHR